MNHSLSLTGAGAGRARGATDYLAEVDVLRAVAVAAVIASHVSPNLLGGGYRGVDVFFVVSGFLVTRAHLLKKEEFSAVEFWVGRLSRIVPPLIVLTIIVVPTAQIILVIADDHRSFFESLLYQGIFAQNWYYASSTSDYFHGLKQAKPALHLWSIAVEMQFYLLFGVVVPLVATRRRLLPLTLLTAVAVTVSFLFARQDVGVEGYYVLHFRIWEFGMGVLVAILGRDAPRYAKFSHLAVGVEVLLILALVVPMFGPPGNMDWEAAIVTCLGAAGLLYVADRRRGILLHAASGWVFLALAGRASYSLYLWHWPLFAFAAYLSFDFGSRVEHVLGLMLVLIPLALASYFLVELRLRRHLSRTATLLLSLGFLLSSAWLSQVPFLSPSERDHRLHNFEVESAFDPGCGGDTCEAGIGTQTVVLWGDSHARAVWQAMKEMAQAHGVRLVAVFGCMPGRRDGLCEAQYQAIRRLLDEPGTRDVLLAARWAMYAEGFSTSEPEEEGTRFFSHSGKTATSQVEMAALWRAALFDAFGDLGRERLVVLDQVPAYPYFPAKEYLLRALGLVSAPLPPKPLEVHRREQRVVDTFFASVGVRRLDPAKVLCPAGSCTTMREGTPLYYDDDHLSVAGARALRSLLAPLFVRSEAPLLGGRTH